MRWLLAPALIHGVLVTFLARDAHAQAPPAVSLARAVRVSKGATCLEEARLEEHVRTWLGRDTVQADTQVVVRGDAANPRAVEFEIVRGSLIRRRRFDSTPSGCDETHAAVGLAIALAIDASVLRQFIEPPVESPVRLLSFQGGGGYEVLPGFSVGAKASVEYGIREWLSGRVSLRAEYSPRDSIAGTSGTFDAALVAGSLEFCAGGRLVDPLRVALCAGAGVGGIRAAGQGFSVSHAGMAPWLGVFSGVRFDLTLGVRWVLDVDMAIPTVAPRYSVQLSGGGDLSRDHKVAGILVNLGPAFEF